MSFGLDDVLYRPAAWMADLVNEVAAAGLLVRVTGQRMFDSSHTPCINGSPVNIGLGLGSRSRPQQDVDLWIGQNSFVRNFIAVLLPTNRNVCCGICAAGAGAPKQQLRGPSMGHRRAVWTNGLL